MQIKNKFKSIFDFSSLNKAFIIPSIFLAMAMIVIYSPIKNIGITSFDRTLGNGVLEGVDISKRISNIIFYDFILVPLMILLVFFVIATLCKKLDKNSDEAIKFLNVISIISLVPLSFVFMNRLSKGNILGLEMTFPFVLISLIVLFLIIKSRIKTIEFSVFKWSIFAAIPIMLFAGVLLNKINVSISIYLLTIIYALILIFVFLITSIFKKYINFLNIKKAYLPVVIAPIIVSLFLELVNILNQYSIFINNKFVIILSIYGGAFVLFVGYYIFLNNKSETAKKFSFEKYYYPLILVTLILIQSQLSLQYIVGGEFFENANHGTAISELFYFGRLPIIENFDAHMLQYQLGNILYGILNNDYQGAIYLGYSLNPIYFILYYFLVSKFLNKDMAFFFMILFPVISENMFFLFPLVPLVILSFLYAYRVKKYKGYLAFWISIGITCLFRLDIGFAVTFASIITWITIGLIRKNSVSIKKILVSAIYVIIGAVGIFSVLCIGRGINPVHRLIEFLRLCMSNVNWGLSSIGEPSTVAYMLCYFIVPIVTFALILRLVFTKWKEKEFVSDERFIIALIIGVIFIFNIPRGIVRHSLAENTTINIISTAPIFISMFIYIFSKKNKLLYFIIANISLMLIVNLSMNPNTSLSKPVIDTALSKYIKFEEYNTIVTEKKKRVTHDESISEVYEPLKEILDKTLLSNETYLDFTNQTLLYALTIRKKPVYVNQSPGLLSGEATQVEFINQAESMSDNIPFVLMPIEDMVLTSAIDGIKNSYRYYLVTEYIGDNFKPLFRNSKFAIWCRNDRFDEKLQLISNLIESNELVYDEISLIDYNYLEDEYHLHELKNIPYIWANYDEKTIEEKEVQVNIDKRKDIYDFSGINKTSGNYLYINASSANEGNMKIEFGSENDEEFIKLIEFNFYLEPGDNNEYLIRISGDFRWYSDEINSMRITSDNDSVINKASILKGDTLK